MPQIDPNKFDNFDYLIRPDFNWSNFDQNMLEAVAEDIVSKKRSSHILLGKIALAHEKLKDRTTLKEFAKNVGISYKGLTAYKSVVEKFDGVEIAPDVSWGALLALVKQEKPKEALGHAMDEGLSSAEIIRLYRDTEIKEKRCPNCNALLQ